MLPLESLQRAFAALLLREDVSILRGLIDGDDISPEKRMNIYLNNFRGSLHGALAGIYPVIARLVGSDFFQFLFGRYLQLHPARSGDLRDFGRHLPEFLDSFEPTASLPYLVDVARLEWAYHIVLHASSTAHFEVESLAGLAPDAFPNLKFKLGSACRLVRSRYPIFRIWEVNQEDYVGDCYTDLDEGSQTVLVVRPNKVVELWWLNPAEVTFIETIIAGHSLGRAVEAAIISAHDFDLDTLLDKYVRSGALVLENLSTVVRQGGTNREEPAESVVSRFNGTPP